MDRDAAKDATKIVQDVQNLDPPGSNAVRFADWMAGGGITSRVMQQGSDNLRADWQSVTNQGADYTKQVEAQIKKVVQQDFDNGVYGQNGNTSLVKNLWTGISNPESFEGLQALEGSSGYLELSKNIYGNLGNRLNVGLRPDGQVSVRNEIEDGIDRAW